MISHCNGSHSKISEAVKAYLIKNSKGEGGGGGNNHTHTHTHTQRGGGEGGGGSEGSRKDWAELYGCIK